MSIEKTLDRILFILYDKQKLHWKRVSSVDIIAFGKQKFNLQLSDEQINFALRFLIEEGYVTIDDSKIPHHFSLSVKGILKASTGGFQKDKFNKKVTNILYVVSLIAVIVAGLYYIFEICKELHLFCYIQGANGKGLFMSYLSFK
jgi:hypothetical protein